MKKQQRHICKILFDFLRVMELFGHILYTHENRRTNSGGILVSFGCFYFLFIQFIIVLMCLCLCKNNKKQNKTKTKNKKTLKKQINKKCFRNTYAPPWCKIQNYPAPNLVLIKWSGHKIVSGQHSGLRRVIWPWPLNMWRENQ